METQVTKPLSHKKAIRQTLAQQKNTWVSLTELSQITQILCRSQCYVVHSRIAEIRRDAEEQGYKLLNKTELVNGVRHSFYKLEMP